MYMAVRTRYILQQEYRKHVDAIKCDLCNHAIVNDNDHSEMEIANAMASIEYQVGYGSPYDGNVYRLDVCHHCLQKHGTKIE